MHVLINKLHSSDLLGGIFHTVEHCLKRELADCESVLDLGCGPDSIIKKCENVKYSVGVEAFKPYLDRSKAKKIHKEYLHAKIENVNFPDKSFDAVILIEVLEHLSKKSGLEMIKKIQRWAKKKIIVTTPNGFIPQKEVDSNEMQKHLSGWNLREMKELGFTSRGLAGFKLLRQEVQAETMGNDLTTSIRFRPKLLWFIVATLSQLITYFFPNYAFELFNVKKVTVK